MNGDLHILHVLKYSIGLLSGEPHFSQTYFSGRDFYTGLGGGSGRVPILPENK